MDIISSRYRKPKRRPSKCKQAALNKIHKRWSALKKVPVPASNQQIGSGSDLMNSVDQIVCTASTSALKLQSYEEISRKCSSKSDIPSYAFVNTNVWDNVLGNVKCCECMFGTLTVSYGSNFGFATKFEVQCKDCGHVFGSAFTSPRASEQKSFEINKKLCKHF